MMMFFRWEIYAALGMPALTFYSLRKLSLDELGMQTLEMGNLTLLWLIGHFCKKALKEDGEPAWDSGLWPVYSVWFPGKRLKVLVLIQVSCVAMDSLFWASVLLSIMCCIRVPLRANAVWVWSTNVILEVKVDLCFLPLPLLLLIFVEDRCAGSDEDWEDGWDRSLAPRKVIIKCRTVYTELSKSYGHA